ncbi:MAG: pyruvate kinase [Anaerolineaceae bacterium]|jgi:pyruvate kinase
MRYTKIICTLGPSTSTDEAVTQLLEAGMNVARLNFSHGTHDFHAAMIERIRRCSNALKKPVAILQDLQGPKLRVGDLPDEGVQLVDGSTVYLYVVGESQPQMTSGQVYLPLLVPNLAKAVVPGKRILLDDGNLELQVTGLDQDTVIAKVVHGGKITSHKGVNLPGTNLGIPGFTAKDRIDLEFGLSQDIDCLAVSFIEKASDITVVRDAIRQINPEKARLPIIAKLERPEAIKNVHEIMHEADGVMVARGDLAVETSPSTVPVIQKEVIRMANRHAKVVITATQMLDSMMRNPRPTRAEASDVANAVFDGTDLVMLSGETASGAFPIESVKMMDQIVREAEKHSIEWSRLADLPEEAKKDDALSISRAARELAHDRNVSNIAVFTHSGKTALLMSKTRPRVPILACTPLCSTYHLLNLYWGVVPLIVAHAATLEEMVRSVDKALNKSHLKTGQQVVLISGFPLDANRPPNLALLHTLGEDM